MQHWLYSVLQYNTLLVQSENSFCTNPTQQHTLPFPKKNKKKTKENSKKKFKLVKIKYLSKTAISVCRFF